MGETIPGNPTPPKPQKKKKKKKKPENDDGKRRTAESRWTEKRKI